MTVSNGSITLLQLGHSSCHFSAQTLTSKGERNLLRRREAATVVLSTVDSASVRSHLLVYVSLAMIVNLVVIVLK